MSFQNDPNDYGYQNQPEPVRYDTSEMYVEPQQEEYWSMPRQEMNHRHPIKPQDSFIDDSIFEKTIVPNQPTLHSNSSTTNLIGKEVDQNIKENPKKFMYGCVPVNKRSHYWCMGSTTIIFLIIGIIGFLFYPRMPEMRIQSITVAPGNSFSLTPVDLTKEDIDFKFEMGMIMNISVKNNNLYQLRIESIDLSAFVMANATLLNRAIPFPAETLFSRILENRVRITEQNQKYQIGTGGRKVPIVFPSGREVLFQMLLFISYTPNKQFKTVNDPTLNEIIQLCIAPPVLPQGQNRTTQIRYEAQSDIAALRWLPFRFTTSGDVNINCPFQGAARDNFISALKGTQSNQPEGQQTTSTRN
jgi:hypothetical protein